jgi:hypothetical protein
MRRGLDEAVEATREAANGIGAGLGEDLKETRDRVLDQAESAKQGLAGQVGETAAALNTAAEQFGAQSVQGDLFRGAARGLEALSQALEGNSMSGLASDLTDFGRRNPAAFLGGAALVGFALARFAQASAEPDPESSDSGLETTP